LLINKATGLGGITPEGKINKLPELSGLTIKSSILHYELLNNL